MREFQMVDLLVVAWVDTMADHLVVRKVLMTVVMRADLTVGR